MTKIAIDARESGTSTGRYIDKLVEYLHGLKPEFDIVVLTKKHRLDFFKKVAPGFTVREAPYKEFTFAEQLGYLKLLRDLKADLVHFGKTEQPVLYRGLSVTTVHDLINALMHNPSRYRNPLYFKFKQLVYRWVIKRVAHKSRAIITPSEFVKNQLVDFSHIDPAKVAVTLESADHITATAEPYKPVEGKQFIMYVGRPTLHKNLGRLIDAFAVLQQSRPDLYLALAGKSDANYQSHADRVRRDGIKNVIFTGFISDGQLRWMYEHCQAYIFPSLSEGFGLPGLEAMAHGAPVVSSNATCLPEIYGEAAEYFDPNTIQSIVKAIERILTDDKRRSELIHRGNAQVAKYSWRRMAEQTLEIYKVALGKT